MDLSNVAFGRDTPLYYQETITMKKDKRLEAIEKDCYNMSSPLTKKIVLALCKEGLCNLSYADYFAKVIEQVIKKAGVKK